MKSHSHQKKSSSKRLEYFLLRWAVGVLTVSGVMVANAADQTFTGIHHQYQDPKPLGMGDAFIAVADDYNAILYNPAGLARREDGQINLALEVGGTSTYPTFIKDVSSASSTQGTDIQKFTAMSELLEKNYGKAYSLRTSLLQGVWVRRHWGIAVLPADATVEMSIQKQGTPAIDVRSYLDSTIAYGYGNDIKGVPGRLSWGTTAKLINRGYLAKQVNAIDLIADSNVVKTSDFQEGYTVDMDLGTLYTPDIPSDGFWSYFRYARPTFGFVARNIFDYGFGQTFKLINKNASTNNPPERLYRVFDFGSKWEYPPLWIFRGRGLLDIRDLGHPSYTWRKSVHVGFEFDWTVTSWWKGQWRVGLNQMYYTAGVSALFSIFRLDLATYGEEFGALSAPVENRVYQVKLNMDF